MTDIYIMSAPKKNFISPDYIKAHYSTKFWIAYSEYLERHYDEPIFDDVCNKLGAGKNYLLTDGNWVSNEFTKMFMHELKLATGEPNIAELVGEETLREENINPIEYAIVKLLPTWLFLKFFPIEAGKVNALGEFKVLIAQKGYFEFALNHNIAEPCVQDVCKNTVGIFRSLGDVHNLDSISVSHPLCVHKGDEECRFVVKYKKSLQTKQKMIFFLKISLLMATAVYSKNIVDTLGIQTEILGLMVFISVLLGILYFNLASKVRNVTKHNLLHHKQLKQKHKDVVISQKKLDRRYKEANLLKDLSLNLIKLDNETDVINECLNQLHEVFNYPKSFVMLIDPDEKWLYTVATRGFLQNDNPIQKLKVRYPAEEDKPLVFANVLKEGKVIQILDIYSFSSQLNEDNKKLVSELGVTSIVISPIQSKTYKFGLLVVGTAEEEQPLTPEDSHLIENITQQLSLFFQNVRNFERERVLRNLFQKYVPLPALENIENLNRGDGTMRPKKNVVTSLFVDLRGFTETSENFPPEKVVLLINTYVAYVTSLVAEEGGIVDNLVGDGIVAFFPAEDSNRTYHATQALRCATKILAHIDQFYSNLASMGLPKKLLGIGLHSGPAVVGSIGSSTKMNYTAVGDTVNLAARLEAKSKDFQNLDQSVLLFSEDVLKRSRLMIECENVGSIEIRGRTKKINGYVMNETNAKSSMNNIHTLVDSKAKHYHEKRDRNRKAS